MGRSRMRRSVRQIDMKEEYQKFLLIKHPNTDCSAERFTRLSTDPQRGIITDPSIKEAIIILECEGRRIMGEVMQILIRLHKIWVRKFTNKKINQNKVFQEKRFCIL